MQWWNFNQKEMTTIHAYKHKRVYSRNIWMSRVCVTQKISYYRLVEFSGCWRMIPLCIWWCIQRERNNRTLWNVVISIGIFKHLHLAPVFRITKRFSFDSFTNFKTALHLYRTTLNFSCLRHSCSSLLGSQSISGEENLRLGRSRCGLPVIRWLEIFWTKPSYMYNLLIVLYITKQLLVLLGWSLRLFQCNEYIKLSGC